MTTPRWLLQRVLPGAAPVPPPGSRPPRRAAWRAPLSYHWLAFWDDRARYALASTGRVRRQVVVVPLEKVQSVRLRQGPVERWLRPGHCAHRHRGPRLAGAGGVSRRAEADALLWRLTDLARDARRRAR